MDGVIALVIHYKYLILFPLAALEGPAVSLVAGSLISLGYLELAPAFAIILLGDFIPDLAFYFIGRHARNQAVPSRFSKHLAFLSHHLRFLERLWVDHGGKTMFVSKLAYGLSAPLLMSAGLTNMPLRRYVGYVVPVAIFKCGAIMAMGYILAQSYLSAAKYIRGAGLMFAGLVLLVVGAYVLIAVRARRTVLELEQEASCE